MLYGVGTGASFPLAMTLILKRSRDVAQTGRLSAATQSAGLSDRGDRARLAVGLLHEATGGWRAGLVLLLVLLWSRSRSGLAAARPRLVAAGA